MTNKGQEGLIYAAIISQHTGTLLLQLEGILDAGELVGEGLVHALLALLGEILANVLAQLCQRVIAQGLPQDTCLNINLPPATSFRGWRVCRQARGQWTAEWLPLTEFPEQRSFQLTGQFTDLEPEAPDTDFAALRAGYASIVPVTIDMTAHAALSTIRAMLQP